MASAGDVAQPVEEYGPFWIWALKVVLVLPVAGVVLFGGLIWAMHDHYEFQAWPNFRLFIAASRIREEALATGGRFVADSTEVRKILAEQDAWQHPFRFEVLDEDGRHARVYSLGHDDRPGGDGCDADIVWWIDMHDETSTWDVDEAPKAWVEAGWGR